MLLIAAAAFALLVALSARRLLRRPGDLAEHLVRFSTADLATARPDWARAMAAELACLEGRRIRLRFSLGCARAALSAPSADARPAPIARLGVLATAATTLALSVVAQRRLASVPGTARGETYEFAAIALVLTAVALHARQADRQLRRGSPQASAARRSGIAIGAALGLMTLVISLPLGASLSCLRGAGGLIDPVIPLAPFGCLLAGVLAARASGDRGSGRTAGVWAGRVAGLIVAIGLLAATLWASPWLVHDPATLHAYRETLRETLQSSRSGLTFSISGYVLGENLDTALVSALLTFPLIGLVFGSLGGILGSASRTEARDEDAEVGPC